MEIEALIEALHRMKDEGVQRVDVKTFNWPEWRNEVEPLQSSQLAVRGDALVLDLS